MSEAQVNVENIRNAIEADAHKEAERIEEVARKRADDKVQAAEQRLQQAFERRVKEAQQHHENLKNRAIIALRSMLSMELLAAKNAAIAEAFTHAVQQVVSLPDNGYTKLLLKWLKDAAPDEPARLVLAERDRKSLGKKLVDEINKNRAAEAITLDDNPGELGEIEGGFILRTAKFEVDRSLDSIVGKLKEEMAPQIAAELFGKRIERL